MRNNLSDKYIESASNVLVSITGTLNRLVDPALDNSVVMTEGEAHALNAMANIAHAYIGMANYYSQDY
jgi:hypothetical protein